MACLYVYTRHAGVESVKDPPRPLDADAEATVVAPTETVAPPDPTGNASITAPANEDSKNATEVNPPNSQDTDQDPVITSSRISTNDLLKMASDELSSPDIGINLDLRRSKLRSDWTFQRPVGGKHVSDCSADLLECFGDEANRPAVDENNNHVPNTVSSPTLTKTSYTRHNKSSSKLRRNRVLDSSSPTHATEYRDQFQRKESTSRISLKKPTDHFNSQSLSTPSESSADTSVGN